MLADRVQLGDGQDEILALADGRRMTRDIAFALGRGVYATTLPLPLPPGLPRRERDLPAPQRRHRLPNRASDLRAPLNLL